MVYHIWYFSLSIQMILFLNRTRVKPFFSIYLFVDSSLTPWPLWSGYQGLSWLVAIKIPWVTCCLSGLLISSLCLGDFTCRWKRRDEEGEELWATPEVEVLPGLWSTYPISYKKKRQIQVTTILLQANPGYKYEIASLNWCKLRLQIRDYIFELKKHLLSPSCRLIRVAFFFLKWVYPGLCIGWCIQLFIKNRVKIQELQFIDQWGSL
jgi:hypothetical protein